MKNVFLNVIAKLLLTLLLIIVDVLILPIVVVIGAGSGIWALIDESIKAIKKLEI